MEESLGIQNMGQRKGRGVVALRAFKKGDVIERAPVLLIPENEDQFLEKTVLDNYWFEWRTGWSAIVFGYGSIYNHSFENANARFDPDYQTEEMIFTAVQDITVGKEICTNYNGETSDKEPIDWLPDVVEGKG